MRVGEFQIFALSDGLVRFDGGAMFGRVPKEVWKKSNPADPKNRILMALRCLLIKTGDCNILVDTGIGPQNRKNIQRYAITRTMTLADSLSANFGLAPDDIDIVVNTHLHFDHCGNNAVFPKALFYTQQKEWDAAFSSHPLSRIAYEPDNLLKWAQTGRLRLLRDGITEIKPGVFLERTGGHTPGHQIIWIKSMGSTAVYAGDLIPLASHMKIPFITAYDALPMETAEKKKEILSEVVKENHLLIFGHEPKFDAVYISMKDSAVFIHRGLSLQS